MNRISYYACLWTVSVLGLALAPAQAQNADQGADRWRDNDRTFSESLQTQSREATPLQRAIWLNELKGMRVQDNRGSEMGTVDDVLVDLVRGRIPYVIVETRGGFLGIGGKSVAVPAQHFERSPYRNYLVVRLDRNQLEQFPQTNGKSKDDQAWNQIVRNYRSQVGAEPVQMDPMNRGTASVILRRGDEISGEDVFSPTNVELGEVNDLLVQLDQNKVLLARIETARPDPITIAVPPLLFYTTRDGQNLRIDSERNFLLAAPRYDLSQGTAINPNWLSDLYRHFRINAQTVLAGILDDTRSAVRDFAENIDSRVSDTVPAERRTVRQNQESAREFRDDPSDLLNNQRQATRYSEQFPDRNREFATQYRDADRDTTWDPQWRGTTETPSDPFRASDRVDSRQRRDLDQTTSIRDRDEYTGQRSTASRSYSSQREPSEDARVSRLLRSNEVLEKEVRNYQGRTLGEISDVVINMDQGRITHVIVSQGGGLFSRGQHAALPIQVLRNSENWEFFLVDMAPDLLSEAPQFDKNRFRDMSNVSWIQNINQFYSQRIPRLQNRLRDLSQEEIQSLNLILLSDLMGRAAQWSGGETAGQVRDVIMDLSQGRVANVMISPRLSPEYWTPYPIASLRRSGDRFLLDSQLADRRYQADPDLWLNREGRVMTRESAPRQENQYRE